MDDHSSMIDSLLSLFGDTGGGDLHSTLNALASSGIDISALTPEQVHELVTDAAHRSSGTSAHDIHFGNGCDCGYSPGNCGAGPFCRWVY